MSFQNFKSRGVRQGCPLSPYSFVLSMEVLNLYLKQNSGIEVVTINGNNYLISQFAGNTSLTIINNANNLEHWFENLKQLCSGFGPENKC